jgi:diadenosine tetraphosphatase ApaH/serine/threonine PP2A family protein phosphatase
MDTTYDRSPSEDATPSFRDMLITMREEAVKQQLAIYMKNLNRLELQKAQYGLNVPTPLSNEIEHTREQIYHLTRELRRQGGILPELEALPQGESIDLGPSDPVNPDRCFDVQDPREGRGRAPPLGRLGTPT